MNQYRIRCSYEKEGIAKFISNRNLQRIMERSLRRLDIPLKFTEGFSPHPKMSFGFALPINVSGSNEYFDFFITEKINLNQLLEEFNSFLPEGLKSKHFFYTNNDDKPLTDPSTEALYTIKLTQLGYNILEPFGEIVKKDTQQVVIRTKLNNFSHKGMLALLMEGKILSIHREIIGNDIQNGK